MAASEGTNEQVVTYESAEWDRNRDRAIRRDQYRCQYCRRHDGPFVDLHVHHIQPISNGGTHELENLATLCNDCHTTLHSGWFDDHDELPPELLDDHDPGRLLYPDSRMDTSSCGNQILEILKSDGPTKLSGLCDQIGDYADSTVRSQIQFLKQARYVVRLSRGVYGYVTVSEYRELEQREANEYGRIPVQVWDPGEQSELSEFVDDPRDDSDV